MPEEFDDQSGEQFDGSKYSRVFMRRRWLVLVPFFIVWFAVWALSWFLPSVYRSGTLILVEQPSTAAVVGTAQDPDNDMQSRLDSITQQVLSRTRLLRIIDHLNLYPKQRARGVSPDDLVDKMRKDVEIDLVRSPGKGLTAFNIYFSADNPYVAQQVTTELTNILIGENLEVTQANVDNNTKFLDSQLEEAHKSLADQEEKVRVFKDQHLGELPDQMQSNLQIMGGLQTQLTAEQDDLGRAHQQNVYLQSLLSQYQGLTKTMRPANNNTTQMGLPGLDQELDKLRSQLADLSSRYTDQHPDVRKVKEQIAKTEKQRTQMMADMKAKAADPQSAAPAEYSEKDVPIMQVESQLKANATEIANRERSVADLVKQIRDYQVRMDRAPVRAQELSDLTRDYDQSQKDYDSLLARRNQSALVGNYNKSQEGEHFRMIDPPNLPARPFSPNRFRLSLGGLLGGLVLGILCAAGAEYIDDRVYDEKDFKKLLPVDVMAEIPPLTTLDEENHQRRRMALEWGVAACMSLVTLAGVAISFLRG